MARPIKETPILYGKEAERFELLMNEGRKVNAEEKSRIETTYKTFLHMLERGKSLKFPTKTI